MPRMYYLVIAEDDQPVTLPDSPALVLPSDSPYPLLQRLAAECSVTDLERFKVFALSRIQRQVAGVSVTPTPASEVGKAVATL